MMNYEMKMPASFAEIEADEMTYLTGGAVEDSDTWQTILKVGQVFNYIARVFSASSSIINNINTIFSSITTLNTLFTTLFGSTSSST